MDDRDLIHGEVDEDSTVEGKELDRESKAAEETVGESAERGIDDGDAVAQALRVADALPNAIRRYGRLKISATRASRARASPKPVRNAGWERGRSQGSWGVHTRKKRPGPHEGVLT